MRCTSRSRLLAAAFLAPLAAALAGCGDPLRITASEPVFIGEMNLYPLTSAPPTYPSAINTPFAITVPVDASGNFDVALDINAQGQVVVYPVRSILTPLVGAHRVGLRKVTGTFDQLLSAPTGEYQSDTATIVGIGEVLVIEAERIRGNDFCSFALSRNIYSKLAVEAVNPSTGIISLRFAVNPNCGFRSFEEGIPRS
jgi:hypothetical protein